MAFEFTSEQETLRDTLRGFFGEHFSSEIRRERIKNPLKSSLWSELESLGLAEALTEDTSSGFSELAITAFEVGRALIPGRIVEHIIGLRALSKEHRKGIVSISSSLNFVPVLPVPSQIFAKNSEWKLFDYAAAINPTDSSCIDLLIPIKALKFKKNSGTPIANPKILELSFLMSRALELSGTLESVLEAACLHVSTREQFGVPIGGFQAVQHKLANIAARSESLKALAFFGAWCLDHDPKEAEKAVRAASVYAAEYVIPGIEDALQVQGGIAFTWEYDLHLYLRRALFLTNLMPSGVNASLLATVKTSESIFRE